MKCPVYIEIKDVTSLLDLFDKIKQTSIKASNILDSILALRDEELDEIKKADESLNTMKSSLHALEKEMYVG